MSMHFHTTWIELYAVAARTTKKRILYFRVWSMAVTTQEGLVAGTGLVVLATTFCEQASREWPIQNYQPKPFHNPWLRVPLGDILHPSELLWDSKHSSNMIFNSFLKPNYLNCYCLRLKIVLDYVVFLEHSLWL